MKLYKISQEENNGYDTYDSAIVAAESAEEARNMHPSGDEKWKDSWGLFWCADPADVMVVYIGEAVPGVKKGVIVASFNAG